MSAPVKSRHAPTRSRSCKAAKDRSRRVPVSRLGKSEPEAPPVSGPHPLYVAIDMIAETEWSDQNEFEAQVLKTERQIEVHLNEIILEAVMLLKEARVVQNYSGEDPAGRARVIATCEALRDRALEKRQELLEELELAVAAGRRYLCKETVSR